jgi:hypothetical protein
MRWVYHDGGREAVGMKRPAGDCAVRAIAIATGFPYMEVFDGIGEIALTERIGKKKKRKSNPNTGVYIRTMRRYMEIMGWKWVPTMFVGSGCKVHLKASELPMGRLVVRVSKHFTAVIDGVIYDTHDPSRSGTRCVYGYWYREG